MTVTGIAPSEARRDGHLEVRSKHVDRCVLRREPDLVNHPNTGKGRCAPLAPRGLSGVSIPPKTLRSRRAN